LIPKRKEKPRNSGYRSIERDIMTRDVRWGKPTRALILLYKER
jgi:hypothetical protein